MIDPRMLMGGQLPELPSEAQLWQNEKAKYRHWIILFGIGLLAIVAFYIAAFAWNLADKSAIRNSYIEWASGDDGGYTLDKAKQLADSYVLWYVMVIPIVITVLLVASLIVYAIGVLESYRNKSFTRLSGFPNLIVAFGAFLALFEIISSFWNSGADFRYQGTIFLFVTNILFLVVWIAAARPVGNIRRAFVLSKQVNDLKNSPEFQNQQQRMQEMMGTQGSTNGMGLFGPLSTPSAPNGTTGSAVANHPTSANVPPHQAELEKLSLAELREVAKRLSISGHDKMNKDELIKNIIRVTGESKE